MEDRGFWGLGPESLHLPQLLHFTKDGSFPQKTSLRIGRRGVAMPAAALCQPEVWMSWSNNAETMAKASRKYVECG